MTRNSVLRRTAYSNGLRVHSNGLRVGEFKWVLVRRPPDAEATSRKGAHPTLKRLSTSRKGKRQAGRENEVVPLLQVLGITAFQCRFSVPPIRARPREMALRPRPHQTRRQKPLLLVGQSFLGTRTSNGRTAPLLLLVARFPISQTANIFSKVWVDFQNRSTTFLFFHEILQLIVLLLQHFPFVALLLLRGPHFVLPGF